MLAGKGVMINWSNVAPEDRAAYRAWHTDEHMVGRLALPGFLRGRRYGAVRASRDMLVFYEIEDTGVIASAPYRRKAAEPVGDLRSSFAVTDGLRNIASVQTSLGNAVGGYALTLRLEVAPEDEARLTGHLVSTALPAIAERGEISGAHFLLGDAGASSIVPDYLQGRLKPGPRWIVFIEGMTFDSVKTAFDAHLADLEQWGCAGPLAPDIYQLEAVMTR